MHKIAIRSECSHPKPSCQQNARGALQGDIAAASAARPTMHQYLPGNPSLKRKRLCACETASDIQLDAPAKKCDSSTEKQTFIPNVEKSRGRKGVKKTSLMFISRPFWKFTTSKDFKPSSVALNEKGTNFFKPGLDFLGQVTFSALISGPLFGPRSWLEESGTLFSSWWLKTFHLKNHWDHLPKDPGKNQQYSEPIPAPSNSLWPFWDGFSCDVSFKWLFKQAPTIGDESPGRFFNGSFPPTLKPSTPRHLRRCRRLGLRLTFGGSN